MMMMKRKISGRRTRRFAVLSSIWETAVSSFASIHSHFPFPSFGRINLSCKSSPSFHSCFLLLTTSSSFLAYSLLLLLRSYFLPALIVVIFFSFVLFPHLDYHSLFNDEMRWRQTASVSPLFFFSSIAITMHTRHTFPLMVERFLFFLENWETSVLHSSVCLTLPPLYHQMHPMHIITVQGWMDGWSACRWKKRERSRRKCQSTVQSFQSFNRKERWERKV